MDKLFLVKNVEESDSDNGLILSICSNEELAERMADVVRKNFRLLGRNATDFIVVEEVELCSNVEILWDMYPHKKERGFTYAE